MASRIITVNVWMRAEDVDDGVDVVFGMGDEGSPHKLRREVQRLRLRGDPDDVSDALSLVRRCWRDAAELAASDAPIGVV